MKSEATSVEQHLRELPPVRREVIIQIRQWILDHLPEGYVERIRWEMISWEIPLETHWDTYNGEPLSLASLAAQKRHNAPYLMNVYRDPTLKQTLRRGFEEATKRLDMGKSCLRFRKLDDLALEVIGEIIGSTPPDKMIAQFESVRAGS
jgi:hypothetical protein